MAKAIPNPELPPNGKHNVASFEDEPGLRAEQAAVISDSPLASLRLWDTDNPLAVMQQPNGSPHRVGFGAARDSGGLQEENTRLREIIAELRRSLEEEKQLGEQAIQERQKEYDGLLEEKSEVIRTLHLKIKELEEARPVVPKTPKEEELLALSEELERERCQLQQGQREVEELRNEYEQDEQTMRQQMRDMEVQMARERADFARQRIDLQRILDEIRRELDNVERNGLLNERLTQLRQRFQEVATARTAGSSTPPAGATPAGPAAPRDAARPAPGTASRDGSGILRRLFGRP
jgi:hypothetical protein